MKSLVFGRTSTAAAGWLFLLLFAGWLTFVFAPRSKPPVAARPKSEATKPSKLAAVGLPDNPDLEGLPDYFALWADKADWVNDRALFAYWSPGAMDYSYYFEAIRKDGKIRFRPIPRTMAREVSRDPRSPPPDEHPLLLMRGDHLPATSISREREVLARMDPAATDVYQVPDRMPVLKVQPEPVKIEVKDLDLPKK